MRQPAEREADLRAQLAANRMGALRLIELARRIGVARLNEACAAVLDYAERRTRACVAALEDGVRYAEDVLEAADGDLVLRLKRDRRRRAAGARLQRQRAAACGQPQLPARGHALGLFVRGTSAHRPRHPAVGGGVPADRDRRARRLDPQCRADPGPGGAGAGGSESRPAVAAGNVETSSRVADIVLAAFGRAQGQGTMNNLTLGATPDRPTHKDPESRENPSEYVTPGECDGAQASASTPGGRQETAGDDGFSYYETIGGGQGACPDADGPSGVHVAMSNTLNTPVEALEREFPVRVIEYALRRGSGGAGAHRGGDGVVRELEALREMTFSLIAERRRHGPRGAQGGEPGRSGRDSIDGHPIPGKATGTLRNGQRLRIETPGGGGANGRNIARKTRKMADLQGIWDFRQDFVSFKDWPPC